MSRKETSLSDWVGEEQKPIRTVKSSQAQKETAKLNEYKVSGWSSKLKDALQKKTERKDNRKQCAKDRWRT